MRTMYGQKWYKPREIAKLGLIQNSAGTNSVSGNYNFILNLIKSGRLKAKNYSTGEILNYYIVSEKAINAYLDEEVSME